MNSTENTPTNSTEPVLVENLVTAINDAFTMGLVPVPDIAKVSASDVSAVIIPFNPDLKWQTPEAYTSETGKRFRMTKAEIAEHTNSPDGRQRAFVVRQLAGLLG